METIKATIMGKRPMSSKAFILVVCGILLGIIACGGF